ncbi:putative cytochrome c oxidase subunit 7B mitochondrial-like isoform 2 [Scophthalmus maximus]|uniref:Putative cytochrome c oxidase subunit 7B mitochondrial-like isoform 2 n=1 Tax=Scophthalmus maximus TaxID=52904 RepID=A0A2U9B8E0_SCOMX|nr:putative cytochrome c oxidase subunit 7B mitochondrial-like isoform 2 [Scophthalmus maximus]
MLRLSSHPPCVRAAAILHFRSSRVSEAEVTRRNNMYRFAKAAVNVTGQAVRQVRHGSNVRQDFHSKYGNGLMIGGALFSTAVWAYVSSAVLSVHIMFIYKYDLNTACSQIGA